MRFMKVAPNGRLSAGEESGVKTKQNSRGSGSRPQKEQERENGVTRRRFLESIGGVTTVAMAAGSIPLKPLLEEKHSVAEAAIVDFHPAVRAATSTQTRKKVAQDEHINVGVQPDNGDATVFTDFSGSYSKALLHDGLGVPNAASWLSLRNALLT